MTAIEAALISAIAALFGAYTLVIRMVLNRYDTLLAAREQERVTVLDANTRAVSAMQSAMVSMADLLRGTQAENKEAIGRIERLVSDRPSR